MAYTCEQSTCNCVFAVFGGNYANQSACWNDTTNCCMQSPPTCETQPTLSCYFCLHYPGGSCISFQDYYTYGSGAPGMNPSQAFLNSQIVQDPGQPGVYLSHQGGPIYDSEADCIQQSGCEASQFTNPNAPTSAVKPGITDKDLEREYSDYDREVSMGSGFENPQGASDRLKKYEKRQMKESDLVRLVKRVIK